MPIFGSLWLLCSVEENRTRGNLTRSHLGVCLSHLSIASSDAYFSRRLFMFAETGYAIYLHRRKVHAKALWERVRIQDGASSAPKV